MTELSLFKFVIENNLEYHYYENKVNLFVANHQIEEFYKLMKESSIFDDDGLDCTMKDGYFVFEMVGICDYYGIMVENIFKKET